MTGEYPKPQHRETVDVSTLVYHANNQSYEGKHKKMFAEAVKALYGYMRSNTFQFHGSSEGQERTYKKDSALTPEGIVIHFYGNYSADWDRTPRDMSFELISFTTPVGRLKQELTDVVKNACKEIKGDKK